MGALHECLSGGKRAFTGNDYPIGTDLWAFDVKELVKHALVGGGFVIIELTDGKGIGDQYALCLLIGCGPPVEIPWSSDAREYSPH